MSFKSVYSKLFVVLTFCFATSFAYNIDIEGARNCYEGCGLVTIPPSSFFDPHVSDDFVLTLKGCIRVGEGGILPGTIVQFAIESINGTLYNPIRVIREYNLCHLEEGTLLGGLLHLLGIMPLYTCTIPSGDYCGDDGVTTYPITDLDGFKILPKGKTGIVMTILDHDRFVVLCLKFFVIKR